MKKNEVFFLAAVVAGKFGEAVRAQAFDVQQRREWRVVVPLVGEQRAGTVVARRELSLDSREGETWRHDDGRHDLAFLFATRNSARGPSRL